METFHIAFIMDGNGRWAKRKKLPISVGHEKGASALRDLLEYAHNLGVTHFTIYAFSTENWNRDEKEVSHLMELMEKFLDEAIGRYNDEDIRIRIIGDITRLNPTTQEKINRSMELTKDKSTMHFTIAINYGARDEIIRAIKKIDDVSAITQEEFSKLLDTGDIPDPDLLIRTSGEQRISNFLLWQCAYTEFYFTDKLWPDFSPRDLLKAVRSYEKRHRRFGGR